MKICFLSIDVEKKENQEKNPFEGIEKLDNILAIFNKHNVNATLFVTGEVLEKYSDLVRKWTEDYEIGCHNYYHIPLDKINLPEREKQIKDFIDLYQNKFNSIPKGFRAPRNIINNEQFPILEKYGFLYDSSVLPRYPWPVQLYEGYKGRAPINPYWPSQENYKKKGNLRIFEIPESPITLWGLPLLNVPLVATWLRKWGPRVFKLILRFIKPKYINFNMHSWDGVKFEGESSKNSGKQFLKQLDEMLSFLKKIGYKFESGEQIYGEFSKNI